MDKCSFALSETCSSHTNSISYPPASEDIGKISTIVQECEHFQEHGDGTFCPFMESICSEEFDFENEIDSVETLEDARNLEHRVFAECTNRDNYSELVLMASSRVQSIAEELGLDIIEDVIEDVPAVIEKAEEGVEGEFRITGTFARVNLPTANKHVYPQSIWNKNKSHIRSLLRSGKLVAQQGHPGLFDGGTDMGLISTRFTKVWQEGDKMKYEGTVLNTSAGQNLKELLGAGVGVEWSTRGYGSFEEGEGKLKNYLIVQDDYVLCAIDSVMSGAAKGTSTARMGEEEESHDDTVAEDLNVEPSSSDHSNEAVDGEVESNEDTQHTPVVTFEVKGIMLEKRAGELVEMLASLEEGATKFGLVAELKAATEAIKAVDSVEEDEKELALNKAQAVLDSLKMKIDMADVTANATAATDGLKATVAEMEKRIAEQELKETLSAHIKTKMDESELSGELAESLRLMLSEKSSVEGIDEAYDRLQPTLAKSQKIADMKTVGIITKPKTTNLLSSEGGEFPETIAEVKAQLRKGLIEEEGVKDTGAQDPTNKVWIFDRLIENYSKEHPHYFESLTKEGNARWQAVHEDNTASDIAVGNPVILPLFRRVFPRLIAFELCSVQPMNAPAGKVFFKNAITDDGSDTRLDLSGSFDSTYADHSEATAKAKIKMQITTDSISAVEKSIEISWTSVMAQDLQAYHGLSVESELLKDAADEIAREINYSLLEDIRANASGSSQTFNVSPPASSNYTGREWDQRLTDFIGKADGEVAGKVYRNTDWIVCDPAAAARFSRLEAFIGEAPSQQTTFTIGVNRIGTLNGRWRVYSDAWFTADTILIGYQGADWNDTSYIYAPYIPTYVSPAAYNTSTNVASRSVSTRYGSYLVNGDYFGLVTIASGAAATDLL